MVRALSRSGPAEFDAVDASSDPGALIGFLDAATSVTGLGEAKGRLLEQLALGQARTALDVGCGAGADLAAMARRRPPGAQVSGIDASETMIAEARGRTADLGAQVSLRVGEATDLPYPDKAFDACLADTVLQHVPDPARVVSEMARVTRPGGGWRRWSSTWARPSSIIQTARPLRSSSTRSPTPRSRAESGARCRGCSGSPTWPTCRSPRWRSSATRRSGGSSIRTTWTGCRIRAS